jgi:hypothetical protein
MHILSIFLLISLLIPLAIGSSVSGVGAAQRNADVCINPPVYVAQNIGEYYGFNIDVLNVQNLNTVRFAFSFNASTLQFVNVTQQSFFPSSPASSFQYQANVGLLSVNMSLAKSRSPLNGSGALVQVFFKVIQKPGSSIISFVTFTQVTLLDSSGKLIASDSVGGMCFWKSIGPDPPGPGLIQESTDRGSYVLGDTVVVTATVTFNGVPVGNKLVAFQVLNPANSTVVISVATTNASGMAQISFGIPSLSTSIGRWTEISNVELDQVTYSDTINFQVGALLVSTVGGYSYVVQVPVSGNPVSPAALYVGVFLAILLGFVFYKRRHY